MFVGSVLGALQPTGIPGSWKSKTTAFSVWAEQAAAVAKQLQYQYNAMTSQTTTQQQYGSNVQCHDIAHDIQIYTEEKHEKMAGVKEKLKKALARKKEEADRMR